MSLTKTLLILLPVVAITGAVVYLATPSTPDRSLVRDGQEPETTQPTSSDPYGDLQYPLVKPVTMYGWLNLWRELPAQVTQADKTATGYSNIAPEDYVKPEACAQCHREQYTNWREHAHSKMNATVSEETLLAPFDGTQIEAQGGTMRVDERDSKQYVTTSNDRVTRVYEVTRTIGSRFFQYFVGKLIEGPALEALSRPDAEIVLPIGYWLKKKRWVTAYDVFAFLDDDEAQTDHDIYDNFQVVEYYQLCARCHTTVPEGYRFIVDQSCTGLGRPRLEFGLWGYLDDTAGSLIPKDHPKPEFNEQDIDTLIDTISVEYTPEKAVTLGISCEACHYGGREHVESGGKVPPRFAPSSPHVAQIGRTEDGIERTAANINLACSRCHAATRKPFVGGELNKNSSECRDALGGSCYSQLKCTHCHDPHTTIGPKWSLTPLEDDQLCQKCHKTYQSREAIERHTHHPFDSAGSRCMNCHMPKVVEGLEDIVRTHRIDSPTRPELFAAASVNACNLCHLEESLRWTANHLEDWYGTNVLPETRTADKFSQAAVDTWIDQEFEGDRMAAIGAIKRQRLREPLLHLTQSLDSRYQIERQFAQDTIESILDSDLQEFGYTFWLTPQQRQQVLEDVRRFVKQQTDNHAVSTTE